MVLELVAPEVHHGGRGGGDAGHPQRGALHEAPREPGLRVGQGHGEAEDAQRGVRVGRVPVNDANSV
jgi:hypothetical protein